MPSELDATSRLLAAIKDFPSWVLLGIAAGASLFFFVPALSAVLAAGFTPWLLIVGVMSGALAVFKIGFGLANWVQTLVATSAPRKKFHLTPNEQQSFWNIAKQPDGRLLTQISIHFLVKNLTDKPIGLVRVRVVRPKIGVPESSYVMIRDVRSNVFGSVEASDHWLPPQTALPGSAHMMIRSTPRNDVHEPLTVTIGIADDEGHEQRLKIRLRGMPAPSKAAKKLQLEVPSAIGDLVVKEVASVLQSELSRYEKNGRQGGGFGSIHLVNDGRVLNGFGGDGWTSHTPANQEITQTPEGFALRSDNLDALCAYYHRLPDGATRNSLVSALLERLNPKMGYSRCAYFIVCVLWKIGQLNEALQQAKKLPTDDGIDHGLSNVLLMINGLLRYRHPDFTSEALDQIERFVHDSPEHHFHIPQKIAAIRARRLTMATESLSS